MKQWWSIAAILAAIAAVGRAEVKVETLTAEAVSAETGVAPSLPEGKSIELDLTDVTPAEAVAAFAKASGKPLTLGPMNAPAGMTVVYSLKVNAKSFDAALDQFARQLDMGVQPTSKGMTLSPHYSVGYRSDSFSGGRSTALGAQLQSVNLSKAFGANRERSELSVQLVVQSGPTGIAGTPVAEVREAIDDQGRSLIAKLPEGNSSNRQLNRHATVTPVPLALLDPPSKRIKTLRGDLLVNVPKTFSRVRVTDLPADKPVEWEYKGAKVLIGPPKEESGRWSLPIKASFPKLEKPNEQDPANWLNHNNEMKAFGPAGEALSLNGSSRSGGPKGIEFIAHFNPTNSDGNQKVRPSSLVWTMIDTTEQVRLPISFDDLMVP
ncbi:MAG TPA: hypothetical protein VGB55_09185 [Tepidisphaeraceae bacterium]|jgi:hypothetical protein